MDTIMRGIYIMVNNNNNSNNKAKNAAKLRTSLKKNNFIKQYNGTNLIMAPLMWDWFRKHGDLFFQDDFQIVDSLLYGWNGQYWEDGTDLIDNHIFTTIDKVLNATVPSKHIPEVVKIAKQKHYISEALKWNWNKDYDKSVIVTFSNGTLIVDLINKGYQFLLNQFDYQNYAVYAIQCEFKDELMNNEYWQKSFVGNYLLDFYNDKDRGVLQQFLASVLIPQYQPQQGLIILGEGGDGKGVLMGTLKKLLGKVVTELSVSKWTGTHDTTTLVGSLLNITSEAPSREISLDVWKAIIACDWVSINPKYKSQFSYKLYCKHIMTVNELPKIAIDKASLRRILMVQTQKSTTSKERNELFRRNFENNSDALVSFIINGLYLLKQNNFSEMTSTSELQDDLIYQNASTIVDFMKECLNVTNNEADFCSSADLFDTYELWRNEHGQGSKSIIKSTFSKNLNTMLATLGEKSRSGMKKIAGKTVRGFSGIVLRRDWKEKLLKHWSEQIKFNKFGKSKLDKD
jgi:hypothetical protein